MTSRLLRYSLFVIVLIATVGTYANASVLHLAPASEVGDSQSLGISRDSAVWVGENGADGECFVGSGALLEESVGEYENVAEVEEADDVAVSEGSMVSMSVSVAPAPTMMATVAMRTSMYMETGDLNGYAPLGNSSTYTQPGDINGDTRVNNQDFVILAGYWQCDVALGAGEVYRDMGDLNGDCKVNAADLTILAGYWGAGMALVPEPSTIILLLCGVLGLLISRRGFRRI